MKKSLFTLSLILFVCCFVNGQNVTISGILQGSNLVPVEGVTVAVGSIQTQTDDPGFFRLSVPQSTSSIVLVFSNKEGKTVEKSINTVEFRKLAVK